MVGSEDLYVVVGEFLLFFLFNINWIEWFEEFVMVVDENWWLLVGIWFEYIDVEMSKCRLLVSDCDFEKCDWVI